MKKYEVIFAAIASGISILFLATVNVLTSPHAIWFHYPAFFLLLWPISLLIFKNQHFKFFSLFCSIALILYLCANNYYESPEYPWILYAVWPILWWPILAFLGKNATKVSVALSVSAVTIIYYSLLNLYLSPGYPWVIYPAFAVLWWPLSLYFGKKRFPFSLTASLFLILFFIIVNIVSSPTVIWAVYPIFAILWWPLSMYYYSFKKEKLKRTPFTR